jgi:hypothetical protein
MTAALRVLAQGGTVESAAEAAGVAIGTLYVYLRDPGATAYLRQARAASTEITATSLHAHTTAAVERLRAIMDDPEASQATVTRAATALLAEARAWRDADHEERLTAIEDAIEATRNPTPGLRALP